MASTSPANPLNKQFRWKTRAQDIDLLNIIQDKRPWALKYGTATAEWESIAETMPKYESLTATPRGCQARYTALLSWGMSRQWRREYYYRDAQTISIA